MYAVYWYLDQIIHQILLDTYRNLTCCWWSTGCSWCWCCLRLLKTENFSKYMIIHNTFLKGQLPYEWARCNLRTSNTLTFFKLLIFLLFWHFLKLTCCSCCCCCCACRLRNKSNKRIKSRSVCLITMARGATVSPPTCSEAPLLVVVHRCACMVGDAFLTILIQRTIMFFTCPIEGKRAFFPCSSAASSGAVRVS